MRPVNLKKLNYKDEAVKRHRRAFVFKIITITFLTIAVVAGLIYLLLFSRMFDVREVSFNGLDTVSSDEFRGKIDEKLNQKIFKFLPRRNNIFFVNTGNFEKEFSLTYPIFKSVNIQKKLLHGLMLDFLERKPSGIWCFGDDCFYFDEEKTLWGQPGKSSGFIFLTIEDDRQGKDKQIDDFFFKPIMQVANNMSGEIRNIVIPKDSFNEFRVYTSDYYIIFATDSDIQNQLDIFKIFMKDKNGDIPLSAPIGGGGFHPQYIDLRIDGRIYYK